MLAQPAIVFSTLNYHPEKLLIMGSHSSRSEPTPDGGEPGFKTVPRAKLLSDCRRVFRSCLTNAENPEDELPASFQREFPTSPALRTFWSDQ